MNILRRTWSPKKFPIISDTSLQEICFFIPPSMRLSMSFSMRYLLLFSQELFFSSAQSPSYPYFLRAHLNFISTSYIIYYIVYTCNRVTVVVLLVLLHCCRIHPKRVTSCWNLNLRLSIRWFSCFENIS